MTAHDHKTADDIAPAHRAALVRAGIGVRAGHHAALRQHRPAVGWLEAHAENYMIDVSARRDLLALRSDYPISLHAVGLSLGSADGLDAAHLARLAALVSQVEPVLLSDHLSWSTADGVFLPDLMAVPYTQAALDVLARNIDHAQTVLGRQMLIENPSRYFAFDDDAMPEAELLAALVQTTGCGVLLDINNVYVSACNLGLDPAAQLRAMLDAVPAAAIAELHLAGHTPSHDTDGVSVLIDTHSAPVCDAVWDLYRLAVRHLGPRPTLIEWDQDLPPLDVLCAEAARADAVAAEACVVVA